MNREGVPQQNQESKLPADVSEKIKERMKERINEIIESTEFIVNKGEYIILDPVGLKSNEFKKSLNQKAFTIDKKRYGVKIIDFLHELNLRKGYYKSETNNEGDAPADTEPHKFFFEPVSVQELVSGSENLELPAYVDNFKNVPDWDHKIELESGEEVNLAELYIAQLMHKIKLNRHDDGDLYFTDPKTRKEHKFSINKLYQIVKGAKAPSKLLENGERADFGDNTLVFARNFLINIFKTLTNPNGLFKESDFARKKGGSSEKLYGTRERRLEKKAGSFAYTYDDAFVVYYLYRPESASDSSGVEKVLDMNREDLSLKMLDTKTIGIVKNVLGHKKITHTLSLISQNELAELGKGFTQTGNSNKRYNLNKEETYNRIKPYRVSEMVPKYDTESAEDYIERLLPVANIDMVAGQFRSLAQEAGVNTANISWSEQIQTASILFQDINREVLVDFLKKHKESGLRTFLSLAHGGPEMGQHILTLAEKLPQESAEVLFESYSKIIDAVDDVADLLRESDKDITSEMIEQSRESLYLQGKKLLEKYATRIDQCEEEQCQSIIDDLEQRLSFAEKSAYTLAAASRTLAKEGLFSFDSFSKMKLTYEQAPLEEDIVKDIRKVHNINTQEYPESLKNYAVKRLDDAFEEEKEGQFFVLVKYDDSVIASMNVTKQEDGSWYGGAFNVNPTIHNSQIGTELLKEVIANLSKEASFIADCYAGNTKALKMYQEKFGFKITYTYENYADTGVKVHQITRSPQEKPTEYQK